MRIVICGPKCSGKSAIGEKLSECLDVEMIETDNVIRDIYQKKTGKSFTCTMICNEAGADEFRKLEAEAVKSLDFHDWKIICTGGSTMANAELRRCLRNNSIVVLIYAKINTLLDRYIAGRTPAYLSDKSTVELFSAQASLVIESVKPFADILLDTTDMNIEEAVGILKNSIADEMHIRMNTPNTFGNMIRVTTFGESHGPLIGAVLDGMKPGIEINPETIQKELDRRRPGQSKVTSPRNEADKINIVSGIYNGKTTGAPVCMLIENRDQDSLKYDALRDIFRPGSADYSYSKKYGIRDHRGGGRSSGRETASRVMAGSIAKAELQKRGVSIHAHSLQIGSIIAKNINPADIEKNPVRCADMEAAKEMEKLITDLSKSGDSTGGIVQLEIGGVPAGLGDPVFGKLNARLGSALLSIGAVKGIEFGDGFSVSSMKGSECNDQMEDGSFITNHSGGILGGISTGQKIVIRLAVKPTPSIKKKQKTSDINSKDTTISIDGRHDPCILPRIIPVVESMAALVIFDCWQIQDMLRPGWNEGKKQKKDCE